MEGIFRCLKFSWTLSIFADKESFVNNKAKLENKKRPALKTDLLQEFIRSILRLLLRRSPALKPRHFPKAHPHSRPGTYSTCQNERRYNNRCSRRECGVCRFHPEFPKPWQRRVYWQAVFQLSQNPWTF